MSEDPSEPALLEPEPALEPVLNVPSNVKSAGETNAESAAPAGPMAEYGSSAVLQWLETVEGLTGAQRAAVRAMIMEDELTGQDVLGWKERSLLRLLRGTDAAEVAPELLAARDKHLVEATLAPTPSSEPEPEPAPTTVAPPGEYTCPISCELMVDPVCTATGQTYERECIVRWLRAKQTDPISNAKLPNKKLVPNISLRGLILQWREAHPEFTR